MVTFLSARDIARIVGEVGARRFWSRLVDYLRRDFMRWDAFEKSPRYASHSPRGVIELMPTSDGEAFAFKFVNGHPGNTQFNLQTVVAFGALADVETGYPTLIADMTLATAFRTGATSALAAAHLARPDSKTMALIGLGAQSEFQACAFHAVLGVDRLRVFDVDPDAVEKFERNMADFGLTIIRCANARSAASRADIITTITADKKFATILADDGRFAQAMVGRIRLDAGDLQDPDLQWAMLIGAGLQTALLGVLWYAPLLVAWDGLPASKAVFFSAAAVLINWRAFIAYGAAVMLLFAFVLMLALGGAMLFGGSGAGHANSALFAVVWTLLPVWFASSYLSYRDVFGTGEAAKSPTIPP